MKDRKTKEVLAKVQRWRCTSRTTEKDCKGAARSTEQPPGADPTYEALNEHNLCTPEPRIEFKDVLYVKAKQLGREQINRPALELIQPLLVEYHEQYPDARIPVPTDVERVLNNDRKPQRPKVPTDLYFNIEDLKPGFPAGFYRYFNLFCFFITIFFRFNKLYTLSGIKLNLMLEQSDIAISYSQQMTR